MEGTGEAGYAAYAGDDVVTGEGVAVEVPVASVAVRVASGLIDVLIGLVLLVGLMLALGPLLGGQSEAVGATLFLVVMVGCLVALPAALETALHGKTVGKLALGTRTVRDDGGPITGRHALVRALVGWVEIYALMGAPALVSTLVSPRAKRLGDLAAGTYVISERVSMRMPPAPRMPVALAHWAGSADIATLPSGLAVAVRQFLGRAGELTPATRAGVGHELLAEVARYVSPPPPAGFHPEWVLAAVIAERRTRDSLRLLRESELRRRTLPRDPLAAPES